MTILKRSILFVLFAVLLIAIVIAGNYLTLPTHNTAASHFDTLIILGTPARPDGTSSPEQRSRVLEGIREYRSGVAPYLIMTGGPAHNSYIEAHVMAQFAISQGVPPSAILEESQAQNTIQNIYYSAIIMHQHGWHSSEVVSSSYHLGRTSLILTTFNRTQPTLAIDWRTHGAPLPREYTVSRKILVYTVEAYRCLLLRIGGFPSSKFLPRS
jgi:uncharacterized SAM-binding protein YcdF (DUF218 family)